MQSKQKNMFWLFLINVYEFLIFWPVKRNNSYKQYHKNWRNYGLSQIPLLSEDITVVRDLKDVKYLALNNFASANY